MADEPGGRREEKRWNAGRRTANECLWVKETMLEVYDKNCGERVCMLER